ncbi:hypothetical protein P9112_000034 [Eukaryota sp. TZLM1-RC]
MCKSFNIEAFIEPLVRKLSSDQTDDSFGKRRADLVAPGIDGVLNVVDVVSVDVCKNSAARLVSKVHDAVRDQLYCMCKSHRIESFLEPLLSNLFDAENDFHKNNRGDVILPGLDGSFILLDVMSVDPCNASNERLVNSEIHNPLSNAENFKFKKIQ